MKHATRALGTATIIHGNALALDIADSTVDLVVTSPPFFGLRSYQDNGAHYEGQIGDEATPAEFVDALIAATREMMRVLKPSGSIWVNLGDKYSGAQAQNFGGSSRAGDSAKVWAQTNPKNTGVRAKSLLGIPWRYALRCIDELGLILRAEVIWSKPNGLPESVTDRVRRSHEVWFHFVKQQRYYSAVDEIREEYGAEPKVRGQAPNGANPSTGGIPTLHERSPLGKLPGSVWVVPTQPLKVPAHLGIDHFAAFPMELPRRIIRGWSPAGVCVECGEGRRPVTERGEFQSTTWTPGAAIRLTAEYNTGQTHGQGGSTLGFKRTSTIVGETCACDSDGYRTAQGLPLPPTTPGVVLDPFGGTGTTALVAKALGRHGISNDLSADYSRLATWRTTDPGQLAQAMEVEKPPIEIVGQIDLFGEIA